MKTIFIYIFTFIYFFDRLLNNELLTFKTGSFCISKFLLGKFKP